MNSIWLALLLSLQAVAQTTEFRIFGVQRFGEHVGWTADTEKFPRVLIALNQTGKLSTVQIGLINSIGPYSLERGQPVSRPQVVDDLYYESLMLKDPVDGSEKMYPLIAKSLRINSNWSTVVFEIDPRATFQDGTPVSGENIVFSYQVLLAAQPKATERLRRYIANIQATQTEVRFDFAVSGQAARDAVMQLAQMNIVKPNSASIRELGGVRIDFSATGPYRISQLGRSRLALIKNPFYWGAEINTRRGFFNFRQVEILAFNDSDSARNSLNEKVSNYYFESQLTRVPILNQELIQKKVPVQLIQESQSNAGTPLAAFSFDTRRSAVADVRIRQALVLAYEFDQINNMLYGGMLKRPASMLDDTSLAPVGYPGPSVRTTIDGCRLPPYATQSFEGYGNSQYANIGDQKIRLLTAMRVLQEAGYRMVDGRMVTTTPDGTYVPLALSAIVEFQDQANQLNIFKADLAKLGISLNIRIASNSEAFIVASQSGEFDIVARGEWVVTRDRWPREDLMYSLFKPLNLDCLDGTFEILNRESPLGYPYKSASEALARIQQALYLNIYAGQPKMKNFFLDHRIQVPAGLSVERAHLYGYWRE